MGDNVKQIVKNIAWGMVGVGFALVLWQAYLTYNNVQALMRWAVQHQNEHKKPVEDPK